METETYGYPADRQVITNAQTNVVRVVKVTDKVTLHVRDNAKDSHVKEMIDVLTELQNNYPAPGRVDVFFPVDLTLLTGDPSLPAQAGTLNVTNFGTPSVPDFKPDRFGKDRTIVVDLATFTNPPSLPGWTMPASRTTTAPAFVLTHEWGHVVDVMSDDYYVDNSETVINKFDANLNGTFNRLGYRVFNSMSKYGQSSPAETYAEAFAEWAITGGETDNFAAKWYAKEFNWPKGTMNLPANTHKRSYYTNNLPQLAFPQNQYLYDQLFD